MPLLDRLLRLHAGRVPTEDFFTEVVAHLFETDHTLALAWLREIGVLTTDGPYGAIRVRTQVRHEALIGHPDGSRPDLTLTLEPGDGGAPDLVYVEAKVNAAEGPDQLPKYAEHLAAGGLARRRTLVYVTQDYEPKDERKVLARVPASQPVHFVQTRWHEFYRLVERRCVERPNDPLAPLLTEVTRFMEQHRMDVPDRLSPAAALAMAELPSALAFVEEALWSGPAQRFEALLGGVNKRSASLSQLRYRRYAVFRLLDGVNVVLGFQFGVAGEPYPTLRLLVEGDPRRYGDALRRLAGREDWWGWGFEVGSSWAGAGRDRPLRTVLGEEAHLPAAQAAFGQLLDELADVIVEHPQLPWTAVTRGSVEAASASEE